MGKRKSIGNDPLDWIGEPGAPREHTGTLPSVQAPQDKVPAGADRVPDGQGLPGAVLPLAPPAPGYTLERQLLLVDGLLRESKPRPRMNQVLWTLLFLLTLLGLALLFFQEMRRNWNERILSMEGTLDRLEKEKGRTERMLEQVIAEKDGLLREKEMSISRIETIHQGLTEELRLVRSQNQRLQDDNRLLLDRFLNLPRAEPQPAAAGLSAPARIEPQPAAAAPGAPAIGPAPAERRSSPEGQAQPPSQDLPAAGISSTPPKAPGEKG